MGFAKAAQKTVTVLPTQKMGSHSVSTQDKCSHEGEEAIL